MRSLKRRVLTGSTAGITLAALIGAGTVFGSPVSAAEMQENTDLELQNGSFPDMETELKTKALGDIQEDAAESDTIEAVDASEVNDTVENVQEEPPADETPEHGSGVSAAKTNESWETLTGEETDTTADAQTREGWIYENGGYKYYKNGTAYTGWHYMGAAEGEKTPHWSYFAKDGSLYAGWHYMGAAEGEKTPHWSYFGINGWLRTGWVQLGQGTAEPDGNSAKHWSYFGNNGWLRTGWVQMGQGTAEPDGNSAKHWSYFGNNGWLRTGWVQLGQGTAEPDGNSAKHWSYFGNNGWLRTGWVQLGQGTAEPDGNSVKHWSYFGGNGWLRVGMQTMSTSANPDGNNKVHLSYFGGNGWLVENKSFDFNSKKFIADTKGWVTEVKSEHEKTLARAIELVAKVTNENMSKEQKLRACYNHIRDDYREYNPRIPHYAGEGWHITYANDIFINKGGNCMSVAAALAYMAKAVGFENVYAVNSTGHGWAEVDGKVYDAEWERHNSGSYYGLSYEPEAGKPNYRSIFSSGNPYARVKL